MPRRLLISPASSGCEEPAKSLVLRMVLEDSVKERERDRERERQEKKKRVESYQQSQKIKSSNQAEKYPTFTMPGTKAARTSK